MNGTTVYMISIGRLYRTCGGSSSLRLRWKMHAHRIRPHTTAPTQSAAIQDPCHRVSITFPCLVMGAGQPSRVHALEVQPDTDSISRPSAAAGATLRRGERRAEGGAGQ